MIQRCTLDSARPRAWIPSKCSGRMEPRKRSWAARRTNFSFCGQETGSEKSKSEIPTAKQIPGAENEIAAVVSPHWNFHSRTGPGTHRDAGPCLLSPHPNTGSTPSAARPAAALPGAAIAPAHRPTTSDRRRSWQRKQHRRRAALAHGRAGVTIHASKSPLQSSRRPFTAAPARCTSTAR